MGNFYYIKIIKIKIKMKRESNLQVTNIVDNLESVLETFKALISKQK